jgi:hypothetical protein
MDRNGVVLVECNFVGFVLAHDQFGIAVQPFECERAEARIQPIVDAYMPAPRDAAIDRRKGVHTDQHRHGAGFEARIDETVQGIMKGPVERRCTLGLFLGGHPDVAGYGGILAPLGEYVGYP